MSTPDLQLQQREPAEPLAATPEGTANRQADAAVRRIDPPTADQSRRTQYDEEWSFFVQSVAHGLKEPLRGIGHVAQFLSEDYADVLQENGLTKLERIRQLAADLTSMVDALLAFAGRDQNELSLVVTDVRQVVLEVLDQLRPLLDERHVQATVAPSFPPGVCDRVGVTLIFLNLITNAVKYNRQPQPTVEIGAEAAGVYWVRDNGIGIPPSQLAEIFEMYRRLHGRDEYGGGAGAGLAIVKRIVERHGGKIWVASQPNAGSTFSFTLKPLTPEVF